jgi:SAM-dependent methyltransferase
MGGWSKILAREFVDFVGGINEEARVLDVGCGTGSLTFCLAATNKTSEIIGIDPSMGYLEYARTHNPYSHVRFESGTAEKLPFSDGSFDCCLASLIIQFVADAHTAAREMKRVTKPGGIVATCMWDNSGGLELAERFWDAAVAVDPEAKKPSANRYGSSIALSDLWATADLTAVTTDALIIPIQFTSFEHLWEVQTRTQGPTKPYIISLTEDKRHVLKERLRHDLLKDGAEGSITLRLKAWAVRGLVPI